MLQKETEVKGWKSKGYRLCPVTLTACHSLWCRKRVHGGWHYVNHPPWAHITLSSAAQTEIQCNQRWVRPLLLSLHSDPLLPSFVFFLSLVYAFLCPLQTKGLCHLNFLLFIRGILGRACPRACLSAGPDPDSPLHGWKNERLTAGQLAPYASCVCVNKSETVTHPSSETEAYTSGVTNHRHGGMNK